MSISLCMLIKNEEKFLERAINSVKPIVDEIIIVDTGSKDKTKEIAKRFTNKVFDFEWNHNFADARNFSISKATKDWILILDPDEIIKKEDLSKIKELILLNPNDSKGLENSKNFQNKNKNYLGYRFIQKTYINVEQSETNRQAKNRTKIPPEANRQNKFRFLVDKNKINNDKKVFYRGICRLFQNKKEIRFTYPIHETVRESIRKLNGKIGKSRITIYHYPKYGKDKKDYYLGLLKEKIEKYSESSAKKEYAIEQKI